MLEKKTDNNMIIFSGNANPDLAREIAAYLGTTLGDAVINRFNELIDQLEDVLKS